MAYSNDLVDSLLQSFRGDDDLFSKSLPTYYYPIQLVNLVVAPVTFDQLIDAYNSTMKSNPNPYPTATGSKIRQQNSKSALEVVVSREILPACIADVDGADEFDNWVFEGFQSGVTAVLGSVRARYIPTNTFYRWNFKIQRSSLDKALAPAANPIMIGVLMNEVDSCLLQAVRNLVASALPPHDPNTCTDPECPC